MLATLALPALAALIWGSAFAVTRFALLDCPPFVFLVIRFAIAGPLMLAMAWGQGGLRRISPRMVAILAGLGLLNFAGYLGLTTLALFDVPSAVVTAVLGANPVIAAGLAALFLAERPSPRALLALGLGVAGIVVVTGPRVLDAPAGGAAGYGATVGGVVCLSVGTVLYRRFARGADPLAANGIQAVAAGLALVPLSLTLDRWGDLVVTWRFIAALAWIVLAVTILGYWIWFRLLRTGSVAVASVVQFLLPPLGIVAGAVLHDEAIRLTDLVGLVPILVALVLVNLPARVRPGGRSPGPPRDAR